MRRIVLTLAVLALIAAACSDDPASDSSVATTLPSTTTTTFGGTTTTGAAGATTSTTAAPQLLPEGGTVRYLIHPIVTVNPFLGGFLDVNNVSAQALKPMVFGGVWRWNGSTGEIEPDLVTEFPTAENGGFVVNPDGTLTVRYEIDPAAVWSDGVPISGGDFAFTYETVMAAERQLDEAADGGDPLTWNVCGIERPVTLIDLDGAGAYRAIVPGSVRAGPKSFEYALEQPGDYDENLFEWVLPRHAVEGSDFLGAWNDRLWPSAGPFVLEPVDYSRGEAVLVRNERYWRTHPGTGQPLPLLDRVILGGLADEFVERTPDEWELDDDGDPETPPVVVDGNKEFMRLQFECGSGVDALGLDPESDEARLRDRANFELFGLVEEETFLEGLHLDLPVLNDPRRVEAIEVEGYELQLARGPLWESIAFHYGDGRLRANPDSLVEHLEFRRAIAHAIDRDRIAEAAVGGAEFRIDSVLEATTQTIAVDGWERYGYDPDRARELLAGLCDRLGRDCEAEPPTVVFSFQGFDHRVAIAAELDAMLGAVGIEFEERRIGLFAMLAGCEGWEMSTWTWLGKIGFAAFADIYEVADPSRSAGAGALFSQNLYAWGTEAVEGVEDDLETPDCDESTVRNQGPSSVRNEFTERYAEVFAETLGLNPVLNRQAYLQLVLEMEDILADQAVFIPLFIRPNGFFVRTDIVGGYDNAVVTGALNFNWNIEEWYLKQPQPGT